MSTLQVVSNWSAGLKWRFTEKGTWVQNSLHNLRLMLENHPALRGMFAYDEFRDAMMVSRDLDERRRPQQPFVLHDHFISDLSAWINNEGLSPKPDAVHAQLCAVAFHNKFDPLSDWLLSLKWDDLDRTGNWLSTYAGVADTAYSRMVGERFLIAAVARALRPGCKVDNMLILEGEQGIRKSTMIRELAGAEYFSDQLGDVNNKDTKQLMQGYWCIEVGEMNHFTKKEDNAVKDFLSKQEDRYRPPYGRNVITRPRRCVFIGTINPDGNGYLKDPTGARRYWPVTCGAIDLEGIRRDRDQIWAEAVALYQSGERYWIDRGESDDVVAEQEARFDQDIWTDKVEFWLKSDTQERFTSATILSEALAMPAKDHNQSAKLRIASVMRGLGYVSLPGRLPNQPKANLWHRKKT